MQSSEAVLKKMRDTETFQPVAYIASKGETYYTIGYGHYGSDVRQGQRMTKPEAEALFKKDARKYENIVAQAFHVPLNQNQFDALVDFAFNLGGFSGAETLRNKINAGDYKGGAEAFKLYNQGSSHNVLPGLVIRRAYERNLFLTPVKTPVKTANNEAELKKAQAKKNADALAQKKIGDAMHQQDLKDELDDKKATAKAKLTKDANAIKKAQATEKANALKRATAKKTADAKKAIIDKANKQREKNAYDSKNPIKNTISQPRDAQAKSSEEVKPKANFLKSGLPLIGVLLIAIVMNNAEIPPTTLE